ncbi:Mitochondrial 37S ribosomal protein S27 [Mycena indigotica]|uniref:Small ribosomal subunit protein mS33 n=1 Tax=Mycena indigotica TaxID=2126181 RepID=A0A8H6W8F5_9AGAR|nr:Mitochondrial 37S ribosomal protein S27 [Mycena indigotica]KAF7309614.1 Mitochondrial 37S ribosomal protein S27 [Mycena indigotica]
MTTALSSQFKTLTRLRCEIFQTTYNPKNLRTGAKYLRARLRGPSMVNYYPQVVNVAAIAREHKGLELIDPKEHQRLEDVEDRKRRGKGNPKKAKTKADSRRAAKKR